MGGDMQGETGGSGMHDETSGGGMQGGMGSMQGGMGTGMQRPTGVTILAVLAAIGGIFGLLGGLALVGIGGLAGTVGGAAVGGLAVLFGLVLLVIGVVDLALAYGFWTLKPWAWQWGIVVQVVGVVIAILEIPLLAADITSLVVPVVVAVIIVYYLNQAGIRRVFGAPEKGWPFIGG